MINKMLSTAISGLFSASQQINQASKNITGSESANTSGGSGSAMPRDIIDIKLGKVQYKANLAVIKAADEMAEELLKTVDKEV